ncbi:MAG: hypothetical protein ACYCPT_08995, partial [Acidimicrobiales bacterium]
MQIIEFNPILNSDIKKYTVSNIFPEDNIQCLKEKIYVHSNIPTYRQHVFAYDGLDNNILSAYKIIINGSVIIDIRDYNSYTETVLNIKIDQSFYEHHDDIEVVSLETLSLIGHSIKKIYVVDLALFMHDKNINSILEDKFQLELLYYGFIIKYFPQLTLDIFKDFIIDENSLSTKYPYLAKSREDLAQRYKEEKLLIDYVHQHHQKARSINHTSSIVASILSVAANNTVINIRNLFDKCATSKCIPEIYAFVVHNNQNYKLHKYYIMNQSFIKFPAQVLEKKDNTLIICISIRREDQENFQLQSETIIENEQSRYIFIKIHANGRYNIYSSWNEEDELGYNRIISIIIQFVAPIIEDINKFGHYVMNKPLPIINKYNLSDMGHNICLFWKKTISDSVFNTLRNFWQMYVRAGIVDMRPERNSNSFEILF